MLLSVQAKCHAERLFLLIDIDGDGKLTSNEFLRVSGRWQGCRLNDRTLYLMFGVPGMSAGSNFASETGEDN